MRQNVSGGDGFDPGPPVGYAVKLVIWAFVIAGVIMCVAMKLSGGG